MALHGRKPTITLLQPVVSAKGRAPKTPKITNIAGAPVIPDWFTPARRAIWQRYIVPAYWLTRVDEAKCIIFTTSWEKFLNAKGEVPVVLSRMINTIGGELGFDPIARQRMSGEVFGTQERRGRKRGGAAENKAQLDKFA